MSDIEWNFGSVPPVGIKCKYLLKDEVEDLWDADDDDWTDCEVKYSYTNETYKPHSFVVVECELYGEVKQQPLVLQDTYFKEM